MPQQNFQPPQGRIEWISIDSEAVRGNLLGDPASRTVGVYLPPGYDDDDARLPLFVGLAGFTGSGLKLLSWQAFGESVPQRIDRLIVEGLIGRVVTALPDCFTSLGGNQYVNSSALGDWETFLLDEMVPEIERRFRVLPGAAHRAVFGKSSGGYGAIVQGLRHGDRWGAVACHSGDMGFDLVYRPDLPKVLDALAAYDGDIGRFVERVREAPKVGGKEMCTLMLLALAASYDPDPSAEFGIRLPVDPKTCAMIEARWARWLAHDPLRMIDSPECQASLRSLGGLFIDCGFRDPYHLHYPAREFVRKLAAIGIEHTYEEFDDDHSGIDYRMDRSLPFLYRIIAP